VPAGARTEALCDQTDFVPTFLELAGIPPAPRSQPLDGQSFATVLADPSLPGKPFAFGEYDLGRRPFFMRRDRHWKYVSYSAGGPVAEELYDTVNDPGEQTNLACDPAYAPVLAEQRGELTAFLREQGFMEPRGVQSKEATAL
jgi:arylsulfatase A-like enzyme